MSDVRKAEIFPPEEGDVVQGDTMNIAKAVAANVVGALSTAPSNASEMVKAIDVTCEPVTTYKVTVRLELR